MSRRAVVGLAVGGTTLLLIKAAQRRAAEREAENRRFTEEVREAIGPLPQEDVRRLLR